MKFQALLTALVFSALSAQVFSALSAQAATNPALDGIINVGNRPAPAQLERNAYLRWAEPILKNGGKDYSSAFAEKIFAWFEREKDRPLPAEVQKDPEKIFVNVEGPKAETIALENSGEIEPYVAAGAEVYAELQGTVDQALEAELNLWGKPVGQSEGRTKPAPAPFGKRVDYLAPNPLWGSGVFASLEIRKNGGIINDLSDRYFVLVRGDSQKGYDIAMQFIGVVGESATSNVFAIAIIRPLPNGKSSFKISSRYQGQSYRILGEVGRNTIGFSSSKVRGLQKNYMDTIVELRSTGKILDHTNDL
jgi:hypothetical protein